MERTIWRWRGCGGALLAMAALSAGCASAPQAPQPEPLPLLEDEQGIPGGPWDPTLFAFEPEAGGSALELSGVAETPPELEASLAPYLDSRRMRLQRMAWDGSSAVVLTRSEETAQAFEVKAPLGPLVPVTRSAEPVVQISAVPKRPGVWLYRSDKGGTEDYQITRLEGGVSTLLTDGVSRHGPIVWSPSGRVFAYMGNARAEEAMDVYLSDGLPGGSVTRVLETSGSWSICDWSRDERSLILREYLSFNRSLLHVLDLDAGELRPLAPAPPEGVTAPDGDVSFQRAFTVSDTELLVLSDWGSEVIHLFRVELSQNRWTDLTASSPWDVADLAVFAEGRMAAYTINEEGRSRIFLMDLNTLISREVEGLPRGAIVSDLRFARRGEVLAFTMDRATEPGDAWVLELSGGELTRWTDSRSPALDYSRFVEPELVRYEGVDGLPVPAWVYRPRGVELAPTLIWMHGGPEEQFQPFFNPIIQFFVVELGIAVVAPNVRGSSGYGRTWLNLDNGERRGDAIADVGRLLDWIVADPQLDGGRVGIYGASYGGYMTLAALTHFPERLVAGCDMVGISNLVTFLENTRAYRRPQRRAEYGDERDPEMRARLMELSPITRADRLRAPLLVAHGANDPRVPLDEARQIVAAARANGQDAWLIVAPDEGHGFLRRRNRDRFYAAMATFFSQHLQATRLVSR